MKWVFIIIVVFICFFGLVLVVVVCYMLVDFVGFLIFGGLLIIVVIIYIVGNCFYGYIGLGDIFVLVFFGWLSVMGSWYL